MPRLCNAWIWPIAGHLPLDWSDGADAERCLYSLDAVVRPGTGGIG
jgi:hypothetical protein